MAAIDFGSGPNTPTGDTVAQALAKLQARLDLLDEGSGPPPFTGVTNIVIEGDSLTGASVVGQDSGSWAWQYQALKPAGVTAPVRAQGSRYTGNLAMLDDGSNTLFGHLTADCTTHGGQVIWAGPFLTNDFGSGFHGVAGATRAANIRARLAEYWAQVKAKSCKFAFGFAPPMRTDGAFGSGTAEWTASRAAFIANFRDPAVWGQYCDYYLPVGEQPDFNAADNTALIGGDGVHPTSAGQIKLLEVNRPALDTLFDATRISSTQMYGSAWPTGGTGLATSTPITRRFVVSGLAHKGLALTGSNALSATDGAQVRVNGGAWVSSYVGWLYNGDVVELRVTTSASADTSVTTNLKVGTETRALTFRTAAGQSAQQVTIGPAGVFNANPAGGMAQTANVVLNADGALTVFVDDFEDRGNATVTYAGTALPKRGVTINGSSVYTVEIGGSGIAKSAVARALTVTMGSGSNANRTVVSYCLALGADPVPTATATTNVNASGAFQAESNTLTRPALGVLIGTLASSVGDHSAFGGAPQHATAFGDTQFLASGGGVVFQGEAHMATLGYEATGTEIKLQFTPTAEGPQVNGNPLTQRPVQAIMLNAKGA